MNLPFLIDKKPNGRLVDRANYGELGYFDNIEYQLQIKKCIFPFCLNDIKTNNLCEHHLKYKTEECVICFEKFEENYYPLKCGHWIHNKCLEFMFI